MELKLIGPMLCLMRIKLKLIKKFQCGLDSGWVNYDPAQNLTGASVNELSLFSGAGGGVLGSKILG